MEMLINYLRGINYMLHGTPKSKHFNMIFAVSSTSQFSHSSAQAIISFSLNSIATSCM